MKTPTCINLHALAGNRFRVWNEMESRRGHKEDDPWDWVLPGRSGFVAPWSATRLVACTASAKTTKRFLAMVPGAAIVQDESGTGANITIEPVYLNVAANVLRLRRRRRLTDAQREAALVRLSPFGFLPAAQDVSGGQIREIPAPVGVIPA
jgi:hypothetical protein